MSPSRTDNLIRALRAGLTGEVNDLGEVFTDDVVGWSPIMSVSSREELSKVFGERDEALSDIELDIDAVEVPGDKVVAEWSLTALHSGPISLGDELVIEPTGRRLVLAGATFAHFRGQQIAAFRSYFDDAALLEQVLAPS
jgi:predicted ester cyclase